MIQLEALQNNDLYGDDGGIRIVFTYASPGNRIYTGPIERFIQLVKGPPYRPIIGFQRASMGPMLILGAHAQVRVNLVDADKASLHYVWSLSRQVEEPYTDCWMTDGVMPG